MHPACATGHTQQRRRDKPPQGRQPGNYSLCRQDGDSALLSGWLQQASQYTNNRTTNTAAAAHLPCRSISGRHAHVRDAYHNGLKSAKKWLLQACTAPAGSGLVDCLQLGSSGKYTGAREEARPRAHAAANYLHRAGSSQPVWQQQRQQQQRRRRVAPMQPAGSNAAVQRAPAANITWMPWPAAHLTASWPSAGGGGRTVEQQLPTGSTAAQLVAATAAGWCGAACRRRWACATHSHTLTPPLQTVAHLLLLHVASAAKRSTVSGRCKGFRLHDRAYGTHCS